MQLLKSLSKAFVFLVFLISICSSVNGQDCIDYPDLNGAPCKDCAPAGWIPDNMFLIYPHIIPPVDGPLPNTNCTWLSNFSGPSPAGGNVVLLTGDDSNPDITSIETTITGLNTNVTYTFGIYWEGISADCAIHDYHDGILRIYIEDVLYEFEGATEWELAEVCFVPTSSTVKILLTTYEPGSHSSIIVDGNFDCSIAEQCCTLLPTNEEDNYTTCPAESIVLETGYINAIGAVQVEWTCDPPEGLNYLSNTNTTSPTFTYPETTEDFAGSIFKFSLNLEDDICVRSVECIEVEIVPYIIPVFDLEFCDLDLEAQLPTISENGYTGSWDGNTNIEFAGGTYVPFTYNVESGQNNCLESFDFEFFVQGGYIPTFSIDEVYCLSDEEDYLLPPVSNEFVEGNWIPINTFNPSELGEGGYTFTFVPEDAYCNIPFEITIEVEQGSQPSFDLPEEFCTENDFFVLPQQSNDGISGSWSTDSIDLSESIDYEVVVFTPDGGASCIETYSYTYSINTSVSPDFDLPESYCREDVVITFAPISEDNFEGSWTPNQFNPDTTGSAISAIWLPDNQNTCVLPLEITVPIMDKASIAIVLPESVCAGDSIYVLPDVEMIEGAWNIEVIDLLAAIDSSVVVEYIVDEGQCYEDFSDEIYVSGLVVPEFSIADTYCSNDSSFMLPETSVNSIAGTWNINPVDPSAQESILVVFTPNDGECSETYSQSLNFTEVIQPEFELPQLVCEDEVPLEFPSISENGVNGSWTESTLDPLTIEESSFSNTFTPDDASCADSYSITIEVLSFDNVTVEVTDPSSCLAQDGAIQILGASSDMQLSNDDGATWNPVTDIENLSSGSYEVQVRYETLPSCILTLYSQLNSPDAPSIEQLVVTDPSACDEEDGSIECDAEGDDLEYSIDEVNWQTSNLFENLGQGSYVIFVRVIGQEDCVSSASTDLEDTVSMEICDGIDNNCDGEIDEGLPTENYYADTDNDGFGDGNEMVSDCSQPEGFVVDDSDCDDTNPDIYPGAEEIPNNGIDEDCDGSDLITAVHELDGQKIDIYPNPTTGWVTIEMEESKDITHSIFDLQGRCLVRNKSLNTIDLSGYENGIYLVKITNQITMKSIVERVVLNK